MPREFEVRLPVGYHPTGMVQDADDRTRRSAVLRKMRGHEEELLYDASLSSGQLISALLSSCLVRLGELQPVTPAVVAGLYTADRSYLLLELRRITLGDRLRASYQCPACANSMAVIEDLGGLAVRWLPEDEAPDETKLTLDDGYTDREGQVHRELTLALPRGTDEEFIAPMVRRDPLKARDALILRCIRRFGTLPRTALEAYGVKILRDLTLADRWRMHRALDDGPGVDFRRTLRCSACGGIFETTLDVTDFFAPS